MVNNKLTLKIAITLLYRVQYHTHTITLLVSARAANTMHRLLRYTVYSYYGKSRDFFASLLHLVIKK